MSFEIGQRLQLAGNWGTVDEVLDGGISFVWDSAVKLYSHGATAQRWFLSFGHVTELRALPTPMGSHEELPEVCRASH